MTRNQFIKTSTLFGLGICIAPQLAFGNTPISYEELIGKGEPLLYGEGYKMRFEANEAFVLMKNEALKQGISIQIVSSYRDFNHQNRIWNRKYKRYTSQGFTPEKTIEKIIEYSTIPGTSRHHWGTDIDLIDGNAKQPKNVLVPSHFADTGCYSQLKSWMDVHANDFGFFLVYTDVPTRKGFKYEPWHYSYKPLSCAYLSEYQKLNISDILQAENLTGKDYFSDEFIQRYLHENILDINPDLL